MTSINFIPVSTENQTEIVEALARDIWVEHYTPIIGKVQVDYMLNRFQSKLAISEQIRNGFLYFLIKESSKFIGYLGLQPKADALFLSKLYIQASKRGKGYGKMAVQLSVNIAKERKLFKVALTVNKNNANTIRAYKKIGFTNVGSIVQDIGNGFVMDDYKMEKFV